MYYATCSKCGLSKPLTSGELAGGKLVLLKVLHSSSLAQEKDGLSLTEKRRREEEEIVRSGKRSAQAASIRPG